MRTQAVQDEDGQGWESREWQVPTSLERLAQAAEAQGYSLDKLEGLLAIAPTPGWSRAARLMRLAEVANGRGYSLDRLEGMLGLDNGAKKNGR